VNVTAKLLVNIRGLEL